MCWTPPSLRRPAVPPQAQRSSLGTPANTLSKVVSSIPVIRIQPKPNLLSLWDSDRHWAEH
ncbi:hypothetical protein [Coleofasciculus sp. E1-EBD-02]|uniref:hypothetical protein n=1 Tax=Coleofasciculus sp. E1-EBD-02 TaxID=3068481 RepID=UPI004064675F